MENNKFVIAVYVDNTAPEFTYSWDKDTRLLTVRAKDARYISNISVSAVDEIQSPPTLIAAVKVRYLESLHVCKKQKIVLPDRRQTVL